MVYNIVVGKSGEKIHCFGERFIKIQLSTPITEFAYFGESILNSTKIPPEEGGSADECTAFAERR